MNCKVCGNETPQNELAAYDGRCEDCWTKPLPDAQDSAAKETTKHRKTKKVEDS